MQLEQLLVKAARKQWRFQTNKGFLMFEDLWVLKLEDLNDMAIKLDDKVQKGGRKSFITKKSATLTEEQGMLDLVKFVIDTKLAEAEAAKTRANNRAQKEFLEDILRKKRQSSIESLSVEEIEKQLAAFSEASAPAEEEALA